MGLTSALLQSYFVRYPLKPSSTFALPNTSRKPLLKHNHKAPCRLVTAGKSYHITSHMLVRKGRHASQLPASLFWCCTDMFLLLLLLLLLRMMMHCIALHCEKAPTGCKQDASGGTWPPATFCSIVAEHC